MLGRVAAGRAYGVKMGDDGGGSLISLDGAQLDCPCIYLLSSLAS